MAGDTMLLRPFLQAANSTVAPSSPKQVGGKSICIQIIHALVVQVVQAVQAVQVVQAMQAVQVVLVVLLCSIGPCYCAACVGLNAINPAG